MKMWRVRLHRSPENGVDFPTSSEPIFVEQACWNMARCRSHWYDKSFALERKLAMPDVNLEVGLVDHVKTHRPWRRPGSASWISSQFLDLAGRLSMICWPSTTLMPLLQREEQLRFRRSRGRPPACRSCRNRDQGGRRSSSGICVFIIPKDGGMVPRMPTTAGAGNVSSTQPVAYFLCERRGTEIQNIGRVVGP